ncbi:MAG: SpoIIE family protein phosphatase, partial [Actinomycetota bacterium]|nr:SpoIIE family protein phosphatase [Actinomycetota bacterium]
LLAEAARDAEHLELLRGLGARSAMIAPLTARGRTLGTVTFVASGSAHRYEDSDLRFAEEFARRAALAVDNARLYQDLRHVARTLQRSLLPPFLATITGVDSATLYHSAGEGSEVGGDFYDVFQTGPDTWGVVIGDVEGKGAEAAAVVGLARHTIRAVALHEHRPSQVLSALNEALIGQGAQRFCTVAFGHFKRESGRFRLTVASGGHPWPLVLRSDGRVEASGEPGTVLGVFPDAQLRDSRIDVEAGDAIIFHTDGVAGRLGSRERLTEMLSDCAGLPAGRITEAIERHLLEQHSNGLPDDAAVVILKVADRLPRRGEAGMPHSPLPPFTLPRGM